jgi:hypothetical protein
VYSIAFGCNKWLNIEYMLFSIALLRRLRSSYKYLVDGVDLQMASTYHLIILRSYTRVIIV